MSNFESVQRRVNRLTRNGRLSAEKLNAEIQFIQERNQALRRN